MSRGRPFCLLFRKSYGMVVFYFDQFGGWQIGEGAVFAKNRVYTLFCENVIGHGDKLVVAAANTLHEIEEKNRESSPDDYKLQRWAVHFLLDGNVRVKRCVTGETVEIPYE